MRRLDTEVVRCLEQVLAHLMIVIFYRCLSSSAFGALLPNLFNLLLLMCALIAAVAGIKPAWVTITHDATAYQNISPIQTHAANSSVAIVDLLIGPPSWL